VIDVGSGTGCLVPHLRARGVRDILAVDLSATMLQQLAARFPPPSACGNDPGVCASTEGAGRVCLGLLLLTLHLRPTSDGVQHRPNAPARVHWRRMEHAHTRTRTHTHTHTHTHARTHTRTHTHTGVRVWQGDFLALPPYMGPAAAVTMNAVFGNLPDPRAALLKAALLVAPGGHVLVSHPMGRTWHAQLHRSQPALVPHTLPDEPQLRALTADLPLRLAAHRDEPGLYAALLQVRVRLRGVACRSGSGAHA
jgi:SAM-dependent methyltransferase